MAKIINHYDSSQRADILLAKEYSKYSRAALAKLFDMQLITQYEEPIKPGSKIRPDDFFEADISPLIKPITKISLPIIYEDENVIVIDKPSGVISHARGKYWDEPSVASFIRDKVSGIAGERAGIVHRLDRATSGVMICAKNSNSMRYLQKQFSTRKVKKTYLACIENTLSPTEAMIDVPIARNPNKPQTFIPSIDGKQAKTAYKIIKYNSDKLSSLIELKPTTGRTHQLRVHLKYIGHPIIGDELYGGKTADRLYLHAHELEITLPSSERIIFKSPVPKEFNKIV